MKGRVKISRFVCLVFVALLCCTSLSGMSNWEQQLNEIKSMENLTDQQVVTTLSSRTTELAHSAVEEIMRRERMIPLLARCKGNKSFFYGYGLGHRGFGFPLATRGTETNDGSFITVEVAALYLISAIYYKSPEFAEAAYLTDGKAVARQRFNTLERVSAAWESTEKWMRVFMTEGIEALRSRDLSPLSGSSTQFWGRRSSASK